jgi:hypothetical protein
MLLRAGARVIATTRFPRDAARRYTREPDFADWRDRLAIYGVDLRHTPSVEAFCREVVNRCDRLDFMVNNACQTGPAAGGILRSTCCARSEEPDDTRLLGATTALAIVDSARASQVALLDEDLRRGHDIFPAGQLDADLQQVDLREPEQLAARARRGVVHRAPRGPSSSTRSRRSC